MLPKTGEKFSTQDISKKFIEETTKLRPMGIDVAFEVAGAYSNGPVVQRAYGRIYDSQRKARGISDDRTYARGKDCNWTTRAESVADRDDEGTRLGY